MSARARVSSRAICWPRPARNPRSASTSAIARDRDDSVAGKPVLYRRDTGPTDCDLVLMMDVLEHVDDDRGLLRHYAAKVPSGAHFLVTVPAFRFLWSGHDVFLEHKRRYRLGEIEAAMRDAGLQVVRGAYYFGFVFPLAAAVRLADAQHDRAAAAASRSTARSPTAS